MRFWLFCLALLLFGQVYSQVDSTQLKLLRHDLEQQIEKEVANERDSMQRELQIAIKEVKLAEAEMQSSIRLYRNIAIALFSIIAFLGIGSLIAAYRYSQKKFSAALDEAIYRVNPRDMPIKIPKSGMEKQRELLKKLNFWNVDTYEWLDDRCEKHVVIALATKDEHAGKLKDFMRERQLEEREDVVFILFTKGERINPQIFAGYNNVTFANNHLTLVQALFVAARGMVR